MTAPAIWLAASLLIVVGSLVAIVRTTSVIVDGRDVNAGDRFFYWLVAGVWTLIAVGAAFDLGAAL